MRLSNIYGASSSRTKKDEVYEVGTDDENESVYKFKNGTYKLSENDIFQPYEPKKVKYLPESRVLFN